MSRRAACSGVRNSQNSTSPQLPDQVEPTLLVGSDIPMEWDVPDADMYSLGVDSTWIDYPFVELPQVADTGKHSQFDPNIEESSYLGCLSRNLVIYDELALWPSLEEVPAKYRNLLNRKPLEKLGSNLVANHIFSTFKSYPTMISKRDLPPFIHSACFAGDRDVMLPGSAYEFPEPLANCISFLHMFWSKTPASNTFVMRTLFGEVKRLYNEVCLFLSMISSFFIYFYFIGRKMVGGSHTSIFLLLV